MGSRTLTLLQYGICKLDDDLFGITDEVEIGRRLTASPPLRRLAVTCSSHGFITSSSLRLCLIRTRVESLLNIGRQPSLLATRGCRSDLRHGSHARPRGSIKSVTVDSSVLAATLSIRSPNRERAHRPDR